MPKGKKKPQVVPSDTESEDSSLTESSDSDSSSDDSSVDDSDRDISGQKSDADGSEVDVKDAYLLEAFKPKVIKSVVSEWAKKRVRGPFLGTPLSKDERDQIREDYWCSPEDQKLFSAPRVSDSPLALMTTSTSSALIDLTRIHNDLLYSMRIGLLSYEKTLDLVSSWAPEKTIPDSGKIIPAGKWANVTYRFKTGGLPMPVPHKIRGDISASAIEEFLERGIMTQYNNDRDKLLAAVQYALSYKEAYEKLQVTASEAHLDAEALHDLAGEVQDNSIVMAKDTGMSMRLLGGVCQAIKSMREEVYTRPLDADFKKFLKSKKAARTPKESMKARANDLVDEDLAGKAKKFRKIKLAMDGVSKTKLKKEKFRRAAQAARKRSADGAGPSGASQQKKFKPGKGKRQKAKDKSGKGGNPKGKGKDKSGKAKGKDKDKSGNNSE